MTMTTVIAVHAPEADHLAEVRSVEYLGDLGHLNEAPMYRFEGDL